MDKVKVINEIIRSRRAIFTNMFTGEKIDDEIIWEILENANWAPTHRKTEPWFFVVMSQDKIPELCAFGAKWYKEYTPAESYSVLKHEKIKTKALSASHVIFICMKRDSDKRVPKWEEQAAMACAVQNIWLTTTAHGYGGYWSTPAYALNSEDLIGLKSGEKCYGLFYIGVPRDDLKLKGTRKDIRTKVRWK